MLSKTKPHVQGPPNFQLPSLRADPLQPSSLHDPATFHLYTLTMVHLWTSLVAQLVKNLPAMQETWI